MRYGVQLNESRATETHALPEGMVIFALYLFKTSAVPEGENKIQRSKKIYETE